MTTLLTRWILLAFSVAIASAILPGVKIKGGIGSYFTVSALFALLSMVIGGLLFTMIGFATFGLGFILAFLTWTIVNAMLLKLTGVVSKRLRINGFGSAFVMAIIMSIVDGIARFVLPMMH